MTQSDSLIRFLDGTTTPAIVGAGIALASRDLMQGLLNANLGVSQPLETLMLGAAMLLGLQGLGLMVMAVKNQYRKTVNS